MPNVLLRACLLFALVSCSDPGHSKPLNSPPTAAPTDPDIKTELGNGVQFLKFYADWCGPCKIQKPVVEKLEKNFRSVRFRSINVDKNMQLAQQYKVRSIPCMIILVDGREKDRMVGLHSYEALAAKLTAAGGAEAEAAKDAHAASSATSETLQIAAKVDPDFTPQPGTKYEVVGAGLFRTDAPGPAEKDTSVAWSLANEFVHRTALAKKYAVPASSVTPDGDNFKATFRSLGSEKEITVEIDTKAKTVTLKD